jgi:hypothetical protein
MKVPVCRQRCKVARVQRYVSVCVAYHTGVAVVPKHTVDSLRGVVREGWERALVTGT